MLDHDFDPVLVTWWCSSILVVKYKIYCIVILAVVLEVLEVGVVIVILIVIVMVAVSIVVERERRTESSSSSSSSSYIYLNTGFLKLEVGSQVES